MDTRRAIGRSSRCALLCLALMTTTMTMPTTVFASGDGDPELTSVFVAATDFPLLVTHAPGDFERVFVLERFGQILLIMDGVLLEEPFLDIGKKIVRDGDERGLLGLAFHPEYQTNGNFYVYYTSAPDGDSVVERYTVTGDPNVADPDSAQFVLIQPQPLPNHNAGWMDFSPNDGYLYISIGDGGGPLDIDDDAQNIEVLLGKILRLDVDGDDFPEDPDRNYAIPPSNPLVNQAGADEIWAWGLRNPWRCSFDALTGDLYIGDVGQQDWEELNFQPADSPGGENYGWDCREGTHCTKERTCDCEDPQLVDPLWEYVHPAPVGAAIICGYVYRGCEIPDLDGVFFAADRTTGRIWWLEHDGQQVTRVREIQDEIAPGDGMAIDRPTSLGQDAFGALYICDASNNLNSEIYKIVPVDFQGPDCNDNGVADACEVRSGEAQDVNGNDIPDECECLPDLDGDGTVGTLDLLILLGAWGPNPGHPADFDGDGNVGGSDLIELLGNWGPCPR